MNLKKKIIAEINSFNNAFFERIESISTEAERAVFLHFKATDFALDGIKREIGAEFIHSTTEGYYVDYLAYRHRYAMNRYSTLAI